MVSRLNDPGRLEKSYRTDNPNPKDYPSLRTHLSSTRTLNRIMLSGMGHCLFVGPISLPGSNQQLLDRDQIIKRLDSSTTFSCG